MLRNLSVPDTLVFQLLFLNEVLSLNAQEFPAGQQTAGINVILNEVLSLNAQE